jgi:glycosyltransferase involved in cell wall biosynthesis
MCKLKDFSKEQKKISVCMAAYNGSQFIEEQIASIVCQLNESDELIIVNDYSTDNTLDILKSFDSNKIKIINNTRNIGLVKSFETALNHSTGDVIFFSDQDDIWIEGRVMKTLDHMQKQQSLVVVCDATVFDEDGKIIQNSFFKFRNSGSGLLKNFYKNSYIGCCMAIDAKVKPYILPFPNRILLHDEWIGLICEVLGRTSFLTEILVMYRRHSRNQTDMSRASWRKVIQKRFILLKALFFKVLPIYIKLKLRRSVLVPNTAFPD